MSCERLIYELFPYVNQKRKLIVLTQILGFETKNVRIFSLKKTANVTFFKIRKIRRFDIFLALIEFIFFIV